MNTAKVERDCPRSLSLFNDRYNLNEELFEIPMRDMYDFFDEHSIIVEVGNDNKRGTNVWTYRVSYMRFEYQAQVSRFDSRKEAESNAFEHAFGVMEKHFDNVYNSQPLEHRMQ